MSVKKEKEKQTKKKMEVMRVKLPRAVGWRLWVRCEVERIKEKKNIILVMMLRVLRVVMVVWV